MPAIAYVNGTYLPLSEASIGIEDRGYQFADGVYEVCWVENRQLIDGQSHLDRLENSLLALRIKAPLSRRALKIILGEVIRRNHVQQGMIYIQITRGIAPRNHLFPTTSKACLIVTARQARPPDQEMMDKGVAVITLPDIRWKRCDIKSISLLPNVLGKQNAADQGAFEAWQIDSETGMITEGVTSNAWIIDAHGVLRTHPAGCQILSGIVRQSLLQLATDEGIVWAEKAFTLQEAMKAQEAFLTSTTNYVLPVTSLDGHLIARGRPGPKTRHLARSYAAYMQN